PVATDEIQDRSLAGRLLLVSAVGRHRLHMTIAVCHPHDVDIVIDQVVNKKGPDIAGAIPRKHFFSGELLVLATIGRLAGPSAIAAIVQPRDPRLVSARLRNAPQELFFDLVEVHLARPFAVLCSDKLYPSLLR